MSFACFVFSCIHLAESWLLTYVYEIEKIRKEFDATKGETC
jgi:hypothetical protein